MTHRKGMRRLMLLIAILTALLACGGYIEAANATSAPVQQQYESARRDMDRLEKDAKRSSWREPWEKLARTFLNLYEKNPTWTNRPASLFQSACAMEELGKRSRLRKDFTEALNRYERLARENASSPLADDALYRAARLKAEHFSDIHGALVLLKRITSKYAASDMASKANAYAQELSAFLVRQTETATLTGTSWRDNNGFVQLILHFDKPVAWDITSHPQNRKNGTPDRLIVNLANTVPASTVRPGVKTSGSLLQRLRVDLSTPDATRLLLDFRKLKRFTVTTKTEPFRLIITGSPTDKGMPRGIPLGRSLHSEPQLYLKKITVMLDPGHGGKDPGTVHNGITESEITLDIARRTGKLLEKQKINVLHTRLDNSWVALDARSQMAKASQADFFISIHVNASDNEAAGGIEIYTPTPKVTAAGAASAQKNRAKRQGDGKQPPSKQENNSLVLSRNLAEAIQKGIENTLSKQRLQPSRAEIKSAQFRVLADVNMPGVLLETGYCSNRQDAQKLASPDYREALAAGIAEGILTMVQSLNGLE